MARIVSPIAPHRDLNYDTTMLLLGLAIATIIPLISLSVIRALDFYHTGSQRMVVLAFMWGVLSFALASAVARLLFLYGDLDVNTFRLIVAPITEELIKGLILIYLIRRLSFTYFVDGAIYGFAVGIGFAIIENASYLLQNPHLAVAVAGARVLSVNLIHASASALVGIALALARFRRRSGGITLALIGLLLAVVLHAAFNRLVTVTLGGQLMRYSAAYGLGALVFIGLAIRRGLADERRWIAEALVEVERVTRAERDAVDRLDQAAGLLNALSDRFGGKRASQIHQFLLLQARMGIQHKTLEKMPDESSRARLQSQIAASYIEMEKLRRQVGAYAMLYLRSAFPEDSSLLWDRLALAVDDQIRAHQDSPPLFDVFARLDEVLAAAHAGAAAIDE